MTSKKPGFLALQSVVFSALSQGMPNVLVADNIEENTPFPYVSIGEDSFSDDSSKTDYTDEASVMISVWSRSTGFAEVKEILTNVVEILSALNTETDDYIIRYFGITQMETSRESDGITRSGMIRFKFRVNQK